MMIMTYMMMLIFSIVMIMMILASILSMKTFMDREKSSPFECGFDPFNSPRLPFSLHFFLIAVIFLIFDIEITLLIPIIQTMKITESYNYMFFTLFFIIILILGLYHEWNQGSLNWMN